MFRHAHTLRSDAARWLAAVACWCALGAHAQSDDTGPSRLRLSGFGTLGITHDDAPHDWGFRREYAQTGRGGDLRADVDSRVGLQLNYELDPRLEIVAQLIAMRRAPDARAGDPVEWAYAQLRPSADWSVRLGRVNADMFLMADYRNVGFGYLAARPPVELYGGLPASLDGADVSRTWNVDGAQWRAKILGGRLHFGDLGMGRASDADPVYGLMVSREADGLLVRASVARARLHPDLTPLRPVLDGLSTLRTLPVPEVASRAADLHDRLDISRRAAVYSGLGMHFERGTWQWSAEITRIAGHRSLKSTSAYLTLGRRFDAVTVYAGLSGVRPSEAAPDAPDWQARLTPIVGPDAAAQAQQLGSAAALAASLAPARQTTRTLGLRWDVNPQLALKLQWDHVRVMRAGSRLWGQGTVEAGSAHVATLLADFVF